MSSQQRFEGSDLEALLERVRAEAGDGAAIVEANKVQRGGIAGFFAKESYEVIVEAPATSPTPPPTPKLAAPEVAIATTTAAGLSDEDDFQPVSLLEMAERVSDAERVAAPGAAPEFGAVLDRAMHAGRWPGTDAIEAAEGLRAPVVARQPGRPRAVDFVPEETAKERMALERMGLPVELSQQAGVSRNLHSELVALLERIPSVGALPQASGSVIAVIGERDSALGLARDLAAELGVPEHLVVLASSGPRGRVVSADRRITDPEAAADMRRSWRRRTRPTIVAADAAIDARRADWTNELLDALEPAMTWATVEASRKPEDIQAWSESIGGIDALDVTGLDDTASPASVLRTGIPVGWIDGRRATPSAWAAVLTERLAV